jgi:hypothetical protein
MGWHWRYAYEKLSCMGSYARQRAEQLGGNMKQGPEELVDLKLLKRVIRATCEEKERNDKKGRGLNRFNRGVWKGYALVEYMLKDRHSLRAEAKRLGLDVDE